MNFVVYQDLEHFQSSFVLVTLQVLNTYQLCCHWTINAVKAPIPHRTRPLKGHTSEQNS